MVTSMFFRGALAAAALLALQPALAAPDAVAGKARAEAVCAACHGANGVSVSDAIPHLAGQRAAYLEAQLRAFKAGTRKQPLMNAMAAQLSAQDISDVAAHFAAQPAGAGQARSALLPEFGSTRATFPANYPQGFTQYATVNRPDINQVRYLYANAAALQAAKAGQSLPDGAHLVLEQHAAKLGPDGKPVLGADGFFEADKLVAFAVMERGAGWGDAIAPMLRNENWHYAVYTPTRQLRAGVNQAECLACHRPLDKTSFTFSIDALSAAARR